MHARRILVAGAALLLMASLPPVQALESEAPTLAPAGQTEGEGGLGLGPGVDLLPVPWPGWCVVVYTAPPGYEVNPDNCAWYVAWHLDDWHEVVDCYTSGPNPTMCPDTIDIYPRLLYIPIIDCYWPEEFYCGLTFAPSDE